MSSSTDSWKPPLHRCVSLSLSVSRWTLWWRWSNCCHIPLLAGCNFIIIHLLDFTLTRPVPEHYPSFLSSAAAAHHQTIPFWGLCFAENRGSRRRMALDCSLSSSQIDWICVPHLFWLNYKWSVFVSYTSGDNWEILHDNDFWMQRTESWLLLIQRNAKRCLSGGERDGGNASNWQAMDN